MNTPRTSALAALLFAALGTACPTRTLELTHDLADAEAGAPPEPDGGTAPRPPDDAGVPLCGSAPCACANGEDDDRDGLPDGLDPECTAPFDDDEASFATGAHTDNGNGKCRDCYFDDNSGAGDDGCDVAASCSATGSPGTGACRTCTATSACQSACLPRVPNGCDCFGCCEVRGSLGTVRVRIEDGCSLATLDDPSLCPPCVLNDTCFNPCGPCELCAGKPKSALPPECADEFVCEGGARCDDAAPCGSGSYCVQGCCVPLLL